MSPNPAILTWHKTTSGFKPTDIANCKLWLDASDDTSFTLSGSTVTHWADKSGGGRGDFIQNGTIGLPTRTVTRKGGKVVSFASGQMLRCVPSSLIAYPGTALTIIAAFIVTGSATYNSVPFTMTNGNLPAPFDGYGTARLVSRVQPGAGFADVGGMTSMTVLSDTVVNTDVVNSEWVNGVFSHSFASPSRSWDSSNQKWSVGSRDDNATQLIGDIAEVCVYDVELTTTDRQAVENYLMGRWI